MVMGVLNFLRGITINATALPVADPTFYCSPRSNGTVSLMTHAKDVYHILGGVGATKFRNEENSYCGDYMFSGHTMYMLGFYLIVTEYTSKRWWIFHWMFACWNSVAVALLLFSRGHYTIDVIVAYLFTSWFFRTYHAIAYNRNLKVSRQPPT